MNKISVIIPLYNEEENAPILHDELQRALPAVGDYEVIYIDDGSCDNTARVLKTLVHGDKKFRAVLLARNFGQTAAISAGIDHAAGGVIVTMDADLQNDPRDIPKLLSKIEEGYDVVSGWRKIRHDKLLSRRLPSQIANYIISRITGVHLHDYGCTLKAYRSSMIKDVRLYGEMHRFIPAYMSWYGARVIEVPVNHRPRTLGKTKYGIWRTFKVVLDLIFVKFLLKYMGRPMHFFGGLGAAILLGSFATGIWALLLKFLRGTSFISTPLPLITVFLAGVGIQFILLGLLAEILVRIYFESGGRKKYFIKETVNFPTADTFSR